MLYDLRPSTGQYVCIMVPSTKNLSFLGKKNKGFANIPGLIWKIQEVRKGELLLFF